MHLPPFVGYAEIATRAGAGSGAVAPVALTAPTIAGSGAGGTANPTNIEGAVYTATPGTYSGTSPTITGKWQRNTGVWADIAGATGLSYVTGASDVGYPIRYYETATNIAGTANQQSAASANIANGYLAAFGFRQTNVTVGARSSYFLDADKGTTVSRNPASGPAGPYGCGTAGSITSASDEPTSTYGANLLGCYSITGSGGRIFFKSLPLNVPLDMRWALGALGFTGITTGIAIYDGDPDTVGVLIYNNNGIAVAGDEAWDASGAVMKGNVWDASNLPRTVTLTNGRTGGLGEIWIKLSTGGTRVDLRFFSIQYTAFNIEKGGVGPYFVNYTSGDNTKDGKTAAKAWKNFPGDPDAVGGTVKDFILLPGAVVNVEGGQTHKPAGFGARTNWLFQKAPGANGNPIIVQPRAGSGKAVLDGSEDLAFTTAATGLTFGNPNEASITTHTVANIGNMIQAPVQNGVPLRPAVGPMHPTANTAYDYSDSGNDAYVAEDTVTGPGGSAPLWTTGANDSAGAGFKTVTYSGTAVLTGYGSASIVGFEAWVRFAGNQIAPVTVLTHNTATGQFTFKIANGEDLYSPVAASGFQDFLWQIRYHPLDIVRQGQYGWNDPTTRTKPVAMFAPGGTRGIIRTTRFMDALYSDWSFKGNADGLQIRNIMGTRECIAADVTNSGVSRLVFDKIEVRGTSDTGRNYLWLQVGGGAAWTFTDIDVADNFLSGGIAAPIGNTEAWTRLKFRESGRTLGYIGGVTPNGSNHITITDMDGSDNSGIHANVGSDYQDTSYIVFTKFSAVNSARPFTSQGYTTGYSHIGNEKSYYLAIGRTSTGPRTVSHAPQVYDNGGKDAFIHHGIVAVGNVGLLLGPDSAGMKVENIYADGLSATTSTNIAGIAFTNCLFGPKGTFSSTAQMTAAGATVTNVAFTGTDWDGTITAAARQALTANGVLGTYSDVTLGGNGLTWFVPAYGTTFALQALKISSTAVREGHQAGRVFAQIVNSSPESVLSLAVGVGGSNNALFTLNKGKVAFAATAVAGTYNLDMQQDNASADRTGAATLVTRFVITVTA